METTPAIPATPVSPVAPLSTLTPEQEKFISGWSFGAFSMSVIYFFASNLILQGFLMFIPFYNIYLFFKGIFKGRRMSWETGEWASFESYQRRQKLLDRIGIIFLACTIVLIGLGVVTVLKATQPPVDAAHTFFEQLHQNQIETAYNSTTDDIKKKQTLEEFKAIIKEYPFLAHVTDITFNSRSVETTDGVTSAILEGSLTTDDGQRVPITVLVEKIDGVWKVAGFQGE